MTILRQIIVGKYQRVLYEYEPASETAYILGCSTPVKSAFHARPQAGIAPCISNCGRLSTSINKIDTAAGVIPGMRAA